MAGSAEEGEGRKGGVSGKLERLIRHARAPAAALSHPREAEDDAHARAAAYKDALAYAHGVAYVSLAVKGSGLLALLLSTVILLGGYVQSLEKKDFFCITVISVIQAAGIFKDYYKSLEYFLDFSLTTFSLLGSVSPPKDRLGLLYLVGLLPLLYLLSIGLLCAELMYAFGPLACAAISSWRIAKLNHGNRDGTDSMVDMMAALNLFYSLIILQGAMFGVLFVTIGVGRRRVAASHLNKIGLLSEEWWGKLAIHTYLYDISAKCRKDPLSTKGMDLIKHGVELLDSESQEDYLYGARLLSFFINKQGEDLRRLLLPSTDRIQRLIDSLSISRGSLDESSAEIRELAATIVAHLAGHIDAGRYPGAMRSISSLLQHQEETMRTYRCISDPNPPQQRPMGSLRTKGNQREEEDQDEMPRFFNLKRRDNTDMRRPWIEERQRQRHRQKSKGGTGNGNVVILQGLTILERLASNNDDNRRLICGTPGLLAKITAPVYSATLIQDVKTKACADIVTSCLKVLYQLIRAPSGNHEIFSKNDQALSNLKSILLELGSNDEAGHQELQLVAMKILTELALDLSAKLDKGIKEVLITKQLQLFMLANGDGAATATATAGRTLVSLSTNSESNCTLIMTTQNDTVGRLTGILVDKNNNITQRTIAAEIMANLCGHCTVDVDNMKEILPKVLGEIMSIKIKSQGSENSAGQNNPASGDEESQGNSVSTNNEKRRTIDRLLPPFLRSGRRRLGSRVPQEGLTQIEEISDQQREEQAEAFLSLAQVICDKVDSADLDAAIQSAVVAQNNTLSEEQRREAFVDKLQTIIEDNCHPTADSLRIVKLCGQIAKSVMKCKQYDEIFRNKGFKISLSKASETMSKLESCMFFVGTDFGLKKTVRPLFSEIEKDLVRDVADEL